MHRPFAKPQSILYSVYIDAYNIVSISSKKLKNHVVIVEGLPRGKARIIARERQLAICPQ